MKDRRKNRPPIRAITDVSLPPAHIWTLRNGLPVYGARLGTQEIVRIELVCWAGRPYELQPLTAMAAGQLLKEGTRRRSGRELAEFFDFYGANLRIPFQMDTTNVVLYCLNRHLETVLPVLAEMIAEPAFPADELASLVRRRKQSLLEDLSQNDVVAYRQITECFFGPDHPYGYNSSAARYDELAVAGIAEHHQRLVHAGNGFIVLSGQVTPAVEAQLDRYLGDLPVGLAAADPALTPKTESPRTIYLPRPNTAQTAIRIGRRLFSRQHPDAHGLYVLANLLGGYFGSRLMENLREDKGYTYNVSASYDSLRWDGSFQIDAEVGNEVVEGTRREIFHEMDRLREELVPAAEMDMLRNYLMGSSLSMIDGPFNWAETVRTLLSEGLPLSAFAELVSTIQTITPEQLRELAQRYFDPGQMWEVTVGEPADNKR
ncbi:MAG: insulinase family protein [Lewinella sp.]|nr:insulinase family protein [Lewinella sp.]